MKKVHLIMPMAGKGSRFEKEGFNLPKPLIKIHGKPFFYWAVQSVLQSMCVNDITFVVLREHIDIFNIDEEIHRYYPTAYIEVIDEVLNGVVLTCFEGISHVEDDLPIIFNDCDHAFYSKSFEKFLCSDRIENFDGALVTFKADSSNFSYALCDESGNVIKTVEKEVISQDAICGCYYFKNANIFTDYATKYLEQCDYAEFFMSGVYNLMTSNLCKVCSLEVDYHIPFGTPIEYHKALDNSHFKLERQIKC